MQNLCTFQLNCPWIVLIKPKRRQRLAPFAYIAMVIMAIFLNVSAVNAKVYEVGPGKHYARIIDVPTHDLKAGDIVNVYYKSTPYHEKFLLHGVGTAAAPIVLHGISDANGNKPIIDGQDAMSRQADGDIYWNEDRQVILVGQYSTKLSDYIIIDGFVVRNANPDNSFTNDGGGRGQYAENAAGIRSEYGRHVTIRNCELSGNANGIFSNNTNDLTIESCHVLDNGGAQPDSSQEHNLYLGGGAGSKVTVQYSWFGDLLNDGQQCKFRAETLIFRYNWLEGGKNSQLDMVEDSTNGTANAYVYGNVIIKPARTNNGRMINFGGDITRNVRTGTLYFFNNTCIFQAARSGYLFSISSTRASVVAENNIFFNDTSEAVSVGGGNSTISGRNNWFSKSITGIAVFTDTLVGTEPGFTNLAEHDYALTASSPCVNRVSGFTSPAGLSFSSQYVKHLRFEPRPNDGTLDLGAFERK